jgi:DNA-directed RNA polymerase subunit M/transcription elongation factor TFIIS
VYASRRLPPFNPDATCSKCGHDKINVHWNLRKAEHVYLHGERQWLSRRCDRCGYIWDEQCLDTEGVDAAAQ